MASKWTPMRWPAGWSDALLADCPANYVLADGVAMAERLTAAAAAKGLSITIAAEPPSGVEVVKGAWPGIKATGPGDNGRAAAGPTGEPWIDSNGWKVLLAQAQHPAREIWVEAQPQEPRLYPESYVAGLADAAAHGGRWILQLDDRLAGGIAAGNAAGMAAWKRLGAAARFFADWRWAGLQPLAWIGVVSDFAGENGFVSHEVLNLLARANQPYRVIPLAQASPEALLGLKAVLLVDQKPPSPTLRGLLHGFAEHGGLVVAGNSWGAPDGRTERGNENPRYQIRRLGKGRVAVAFEPENDPYLVVQDAMVLLSHRNDLVRFWNGGAVRACMSASYDGRKALLQLLFYANVPAGDTTVRVAGTYRTARLFTPDDAAGKSITLIGEKDAVELHLPAVGQYGAVLLDS